MIRSRRPQYATKKAVAMAWDGHGAPKVTAKGQALIADEIVALAERHDIPIVTDRALVETLAQVSLDQEIPENLYAAVAEVIAFAYFLRDKSIKPRSAD